MAKNRQVVREDVVRVSFDVPENPFQEIVDDLNDLKKTTSKTVDGAEKEFQDLGKAGKEAGKGFNEITKESKTLKKMLNSIDKDISSFHTQISTAKKKFDSFKTSLKNIVTHPLKNTANTLKQVINRLTEGQKGVKGFTTGLTNVGKIAFTKLTSGLKTVANKLSDIATKAAKTAYNALKKVAGISFKALTAGLGAAATAVGTIVTKSVQSFADYEQLVGGVDTLFKDSSSIVQANADKAFMTAGLSANDYMETVTGFSASLLQGLSGDTKKAASIADKALIDMSDNANKMGTDMSSIQNAYSGFAKQNYTMLDNLKLGYGGTKEEMERLLEDAGKKAGRTFEISSFADIIEAIHVIQDEMDITGTTSKEASTTIQGSLSSMKSAWQNVMTALVTGKNFDEVVNNFVDSVKTFAKNIIPTVKSALGGVGKLVEELAPIIEKELPILIQTLLPSLIKSATSLVVGLIGALPQILKTLIAELPNVASTLFTAIGDIFNSTDGTGLFSGIFADIKTAIETVIPTVSNLISKVVELVTSEDTITSFKNTWNAVKTTVSAVWFVAEPIISLIVNNLDKLVPVIKAVTAAFIAFKVAMAVVNFVMAASPITWIIIGIVALIAAIALCVKHWDKIKEVAVNCWNGIKEVWGKVKEWFSTTIIEPIKTFFSDLWNGIKTGATSLWEGICAVFSTIASWIYENVIQPVVNFFKGVGTALFVIVAGAIGLILQPLLTIAEWVNTNVIQPVIAFFVALWKRITEVVNSVVSSIRTIWGIVAEWVNSNVIHPIVGFFVNLWYKIKHYVTMVSRIIRLVWGIISDWVNDNVITPITDFFSGLWKSIKDIVGNIKDSIVDAFQTAWDKVTGVWEGIKDFFSGIWESLEDTGETLKNTFEEIWKSAVKAVAKPVNKLIGGANWVLEKLGSDTVIAEWQPYAKGTDGHKGGNALVNDGRGAELIQMPNGNSFIPQGKNVFIPNAPVGMKVLPAEQTAQVMGKSSPTFHYEGGIGDWAIWDFFDNAKGLVGKVIDKFVNYDGVAGYALDVGKAMIGKATSAMTSWIEKLFDKFGGKSLGSYVASAGVEQWRSTVVQALKMEGQYTVENVQRTLYQMQTESGGNPYAINLWDSNAKKGTPSKGLMQVIDPTFKAYARAGFNSNIYDPLSNILASIRYAVARYGSLAKAYRGVGYANGGIATSPSIFGEAGAEMAIPLSLNKRRRGIKLWMQTGEILGTTSDDLSYYTPENSYTTTNSNSTQNNNYSPTFVLNMNGASATEDNKRKVKRWIQEAISETFGSMERTNPLLTEV